jgi:hypothetical protein
MVEEEPSRRLSTNVLWVGCCGWAAARARYFKQFRTIELQSTFYQPPAVDKAEKWRQDALEELRLLREGLAVDHVCCVQPDVSQTESTTPREKQTRSRQVPANRGGMARLGGVVLQLAQSRGLVG